MVAVGDIILVHKSFGGEVYPLPAIVTFLHDASTVDAVVFAVQAHRIGALQNRHAVAVQRCRPGTGHDQWTEKVLDRTINAPPDDQEQLAMDNAMAEIVASGEGLTSEGRPTTAALKAKLGRDVSAAERDAAWSRMPSG